MAVGAFGAVGAEAVAWEVGRQQRRLWRRLAFEGSLDARHSMALIGAPNDPIHISEL